jgi:hypothetical protein
MRRAGASVGATRLPGTAWSRARLGAVVLSALFLCVRATSDLNAIFTGFWAPREQRRVRYVSLLRLFRAILGDCRRPRRDVFLRHWVVLERARIAVAPLLDVDQVLLARQ